MASPDLKGYQAALMEERVQLVQKLARDDISPTDADLRRLSGLQSAIAAFQAVIDGNFPGGNVYLDRGLAGT